MGNKPRSAYLVLALAGILASVAELHAGTITGRVVHANGTPITDEVTIQAWCSTGPAILLGTVVSDASGFFTLPVDGKLCPAANVTFQRHGSTVKRTVANVSTTTDVNLGPVSVPGTSQPDCCTPSCCEPCCRRGIFRRR